jgi:hypothetical protein
VGKGSAESSGQSASSVVFPPGSDTGLATTPGAHAVAPSRPRFYEIGPFQAQYDELVQELKAAGHKVRVEREIEHRGAGEIARTLYDIAVHFADQADDALVDAIAVALVAWLRGKALLGGDRWKRRQVFIYGPHGELFRKVELPGDESGE